jgi:PHD/YefM family antitoxin component YafN of YafNO toxin-antitoxin module
MIIPEDIRSLSEFQRNTRDHIRRLNRTGRPEVLTVNGKASVVIQAAAAYQRLLDQLEEAKTSAAIASADRGEGLPVKEAFALIRKRAAIRRKR